MKIIAALLCGSMSILQGCVLGPDRTPPKISLQQQYSETSSKLSDNISGSPWWTAFNDIPLNSLIQKGASKNIDTQQALLRVDIAQSDVVASGAGATPIVAASGEYNAHGSRGSYAAVAPTQSVSAGLTVSWLLDFFGEYKRSQENAVDTLEAAQAGADVAKLAFISRLALAYIDFRYYDASIAIVRGNLRSRRDTLALTRFQLSVGAASKLDVVQAEGLVNSTLSTIPGLEIGRRRAVDRIATLLDLTAPAVLTEIESQSKQPTQTSAISAGVPADLIRNRPDIRQAERQLSAAVANIGVAEAQLYPRIVLGGSISPASISAKGLSGVQTTWSFGPALSLPIFDGGRLNANVEKAQSNARLAYLNWKGVVLTAVEEVENGLTGVIRDRESVAAFTRTVESYRQAVKLATESYKDGGTSILDLLDAERSVSNAQQDLAAAIKQSAQDYVILNIALGGGYNAVAVAKQEEDK